MDSALPYRLVFDPTGAELRAARDCEAEVFLDHYGNTAEQLSDEYSPYDPTSVFVALLDTSGDALAACRLITPSLVGLKSINDVARPPWQVDGARAARAAGMNLAETWDVATIAVRKHARSVRPLAAASLYHGLWAAARANHAKSIVMIIDERARRLLSAVAITTTALPGTRPGPYLGSTTSTPLYGHLARMADTQRRVNPDAYRLIAAGIGLDGIQLPEGFVLSVRSDLAALDVARAPAMSA
jgi:hypothetical protein